MCPGEEHSRRGRSALQSGARVTEAVLLGQPTAQRPQVDGVQGIDAQPTQMGEQIQQVRPVGAHGVLSQVSPAPQVPQVAGQQRLELRRQLLSRPLDHSETREWVFQARHAVPSPACPLRSAPWTNMFRTSSRNSSSKAVTRRVGRCMIGFPQRTIGRIVPPVRSSSTVLI